VQYGTCVYRTADPREAVSVAPVKRPRSRRQAGLKVSESGLKREGEQAKLPRPVPFSRLGVVLFTMEGVVAGGGVEWSEDGTRECERVQGLERLITLELSGTRDRGPQD
jgi:hypothetical protein